MPPQVLLRNRIRTDHNRQSSDFKYFHLFCPLFDAIDFDAAVLRATGVSVVVGPWATLTKATHVNDAGACVLRNTSNHVGAAVR
jgi:hypothetical protein